MNRELVETVKMIDEMRGPKTPKSAQTNEFH